MSVQSAARRAPQEEREPAREHSILHELPDLAHRGHLNELPFPPLPGVAEAVEAALADTGRYPDNSHSALVAALAAHLDADPASIAVGPGGTGLIQQILLATCTAPGDEVVFASPAFDGYPILTRQARAVPVAVPLTGTAQDLTATAAAITPRTRVVFIASPHNPTGTVVEERELRAFLARVPSRVVVVLDLAYVEFTRAHLADPARAGWAHLIAEHPNVVVLRTFSKAYGLAALRVGYALAVPERAAAIRATAVPFGLTAPAKQAAIAALHAGAELQRRVGYIAAERELLRAALASAGFAAPPTEGNFLWLPMTDPDRFGAACEDHGLLVRVVRDTGVRVTVGLPAANAQLLHAARSAAPAVPDLPAPSPAAAGAVMPPADLLHPMVTR